MSKSRKSLSLWMRCDKCSSHLTQKDLTAHETNCPPVESEWNHSYVRDGVLYSLLETFPGQDELKNISEREANDMIFMSPAVMELCDIPVGDLVVIAGKEETIVKTAWPTGEKSLTSVSITRKAMESTKVHGPVRVHRLSSAPRLAHEIEIVYTGKQPHPKLTPEMEVMIKKHGGNKVFCMGNKITVPYYGKSLAFKIVSIVETKTTGESPKEKDITESLKNIRITHDDSNDTEFYKVFYSTKWRIAPIVNEEPESTSREEKLTINDIGGYEDLMDELKDALDVALGKCPRIKGFKVPRGILLYGTAGVGKSMVANAVASEYSAEILRVNGWEINSKIAGEAENRLIDIFARAKDQAPSIILIEEIDTLCPRKSGASQDNEKRVYAALGKHLDELHAFGANVVVLATTSRLDFVDGSLRRPGRLDKELEVCAPTPEMRKSILLKFLAKVPNGLSEENVDYIASNTHGFVGADLYGLFSEAATRAMKLHRDRVSRYEDTDVAIEMEDFQHALKIAKPSAMKEVVVEVPNVRWTDIGGQRDLKLKLKQALEWPLTHPEAFVRLGISPPRGLLMFGPPGCSKTMIAKALATETKLNFLNIKGPELFSKWVGESERAVREVFRKARQVAPSIIFIDEIDAIGGERAATGSGNGSNVQERVLAQLLTELDGITTLGNVTLVAATNRPDRMDKALLRPGRFDRIVYVPLPDDETRREIFNIKFEKMPVENDVIVEDLVDLTEGYSGAEVQAICHEAAMKALEDDLDAKCITKEDFQEALSIVTPRTPPWLIKLYENYMNNWKNQ